MSQRIIFGGPSELPAEEYPDHQYSTAPRLVELNYGEHSSHNPGYYHYAGLGAGVTFGQQMPESAQRNLTYNANEDMRDAVGNDPIPKKKKPGAMGSYWVEGAERAGGDDRRGYQIYLGSSMRQQQGQDDNEVALESSLWDELADEQDVLPDHRRHYQCAEPGLISEHRYANTGDFDDEGGEEQDGAEEEGGGDGGRFYVMGNSGDYLPACGDVGEYGCADICETTGDRDIGEEFYEGEAEEAYDYFGEQEEYHF